MNTGGFQPIVPLGGVLGWRLLERTEEAQRAAFARGPALARDLAYFRDNVAGADTAAKLVADPRLLRVALGAFGLEEEANKQALIRRVLESDPSDPTGFARRLVDPRYRRLAAAFGYGDLFGPRVARPGFAAEIAAAHEERRFEAAVGEADPAMRLALNARREIARYADAADPDGAAWFQVMGDRPMRAVFDAAFGLPASFSQIGIDQQREVLRDRNRRLFGDSSLAVFKDPAKVDELIRRFLVRDAAGRGPSAATRGMAALTVLQSGGTEGMQTLDSDLQRLLMQGTISREDAAQIADNPENFRKGLF